MVMLSEISAATEIFYEALPLDRTRGTSSRGPELKKGIRLAFQKKNNTKNKKKSIDLVRLHFLVCVLKCTTVLHGLRGAPLAN